MGSPIARVVSTAARKTVSAAVLSTMLVAAASASAGHSDSYYVWVDVVDVDPIVRVDYVDEPVERCYDATPSRRANDRSRHDSARYYDDRRDDRRRDQARANPGAVVLGGVLGGLLGNQFGGGNGKRALTVAGAVIGASVAAEASRSSSSSRSYERRRSDLRQQPVRRCEVSYEERRVERVDGYEVVYRYAGRRFTKVVDDHPGDRMRVRVDVQPV